MQKLLTPKFFYPSSVYDLLWTCFIFFVLLTWFTFESSSHLNVNAVLSAFRPLQTGLRPDPSALCSLLHETAWDWTPYQQRSWLRLSFITVALSSWNDQSCRSKLFKMNLVLLYSSVVSAHEAKIVSWRYQPLSGIMVPLWHCRQFLIFCCEISFRHQSLWRNSKISEKFQVLPYWRGIVNRGPLWTVAIAQPVGCSAGMWKVLVQVLVRAKVKCCFAQNQRFNQACNRWKILKCCVLLLFYHVW